MADEKLPDGAYEAADEAFEAFRVSKAEFPRDELEAALVAAALLIRADERARIIALSRQLQATFPVDAGEGVTDYEAFAAVLERGDEPDREARASTAEARLAAITDACRSIPSPIAERILAIIGTGEEAGRGH